jgi:SAM-dependent methyltransferase
MLAVAGGLAAPAGAAIEWRQGDAARLPLPDGRFDAVLCQQGLQFVPDRAAVLREMRRVLAREGRLVFSVWASIDSTPGYAVLADALARHIGPDAAAMMRAPFALADGAALTALVEAAGFGGVALRTATRELGFPSPSEFVLVAVGATPVGARVAQAGEALQRALIDEVRDRLAAQVGAEGLRFPVSAHVVSARAIP